MRGDIMTNLAESNSQEQDSYELVDLRGISLDAFWSIESELAVKHHKPQYVFGYVYAMAGGSDAHNRIESKVVQRLANHLEDSGCVAFTGNRKIVADRVRASIDGINARGVSVYPDAVVQCSDSDGGWNTLVVVEVLSKSTQANDRGKKLAAYKQIPTIQHIILIDQYQIKVEMHSRIGDVFSYSAFGAGESFMIDAIELRVSVDDIYKGVEFA